MFPQPGSLTKTNLPPCPRGCSTDFNLWSFCKCIIGRPESVCNSRWIYICIYICFKRTAWLYRAKYWSFWCIPSTILVYMTEPILAVGTWCSYSSRGRSTMPSGPKRDTLERARRCLSPVVPAPCISIYCDSIRVSALSSRLAFDARFTLCRWLSRNPGLQCVPATWDNMPSCVTCCY